jgi:hypothetical protein
MIKALKELRIEGKFLDKIKVIYDKPIANIILNGEKTESISNQGDKGVHSFHSYST